MRVLNSFTSPIGLEFQLQQVQRKAVSHSSLHNWDESSKSYLEQFRQGSVQTLNIYTISHEYAFVSHHFYAVRKLRLILHIRTPPFPGTTRITPAVMAL